MPRDAVIFAAFALPLLLGAGLLTRRLTAGSLSIAQPALIWVVAEGMRLPEHGLTPDAYDPRWDWLVVVIGTPVGLVALAGAGAIALTGRRITRG